MTVTSLTQLLEFEELLVLHDMEPILAYLTGQRTEYSLYDFDLISFNIISEKIMTPFSFSFFCLVRGAFEDGSVEVIINCCAVVLIYDLIGLFSHNPAQ